jgi:hypothetical protein
MTLLAKARRDGAERARSLASAAKDSLAKDALLKYAGELEQQADELDAQVAALREALTK